MVTGLPGTTIETSLSDADVARRLIDAVFAPGGLVLSQVVTLTGLEPYVVQNWVKRGFLARPERKLYSKRKFCRIVIINALKDSLQIDRITSLLSYINGKTDDESDDLIDDFELYNYFVNLYIETEKGRAETDIRDTIRRVTERYAEPEPGASVRLQRVLEVMLYAYRASIYKRRAELLSAEF